MTKYLSSRLGLCDCGTYILQYSSGIPSLITIHAGALRLKEIHIGLSIILNRASRRASTESWSTR